MIWKEIISITITDNYSLTIDVGPLLILLVVALAACIIIYYLVRGRIGWPSLVEANIRLGGIGEVKIRPNYEDIQIAHKAWVELVTRKAALPFDEQHDVISEIYDSWYALFQEIRSLSKAIPAEKVRSNRSTRDLVHLLMSALNNGLRPHLTRWQARFRFWYDQALSQNPGKCPQDIQRDFPQYKELVEDLLIVNKQLVEYADFIKDIAQGKSEK